MLARFKKTHKFTGDQWSPLPKNKLAVSIVTNPDNLFAPETGIYVTGNHIKGDVNADGEFNIADTAIMQKWLADVPDISLADWKAGDLYEDDKIDVFDLCLMKRMMPDS